MIFYSLLVYTGLVYNTLVTQLGENGEKKKNSKLGPKKDLRMKQLLNWKTLDWSHQMKNTKRNPRLECRIVDSRYKL